jgi:phospholipase D1/2
MALRENIDRKPAAVRAPAVDRILVPGETCWRVERAHRAGFLIDAKAYFQAAKAAMLLAQRSILIVGWDFEPRIRLEPDRAENDQHDSVPDILGDLLEWLVARRPSLHVGVLRWNMPLVMTVAQRPKLPMRLRSWRAGERLQFRFDGCHPLGAGHHQKLLVIDDTLAFSGGIDFAGDRWEEPGHADDLPRRTPDGFSYHPHHDVMMAVNGPAAAALGELARERWRRATGKPFAGGAAQKPLWPDGLTADLTEIGVGIARTEPDWYSQPAVREAEALFVRSIEAAKSYIYLESQYLTAEPIANALARRLAEPNGPEVVILLPQHSPGWFDRLAMDGSRQAIIDQLRNADTYDRLRIQAPFSAGGRPIVVHAKICIIDDRFVRVGTANLNHRGLGLDTECDLAIEAAPGEKQAGAVGRAARNLRDTLLAEHLGVTCEAVDQAVQRTGSLIAGIDLLGRLAGDRLRPVGASGGLALPLRGPNVLDPAGSRDVWWLTAQERLGGIPLSIPLMIAGMAVAGWLAFG